MTISSQIIEVLDDLCRRFGIVIDWSAENVMPYLQELAGKFISWEIATSKMWIVVAAIAIILGVIVFAVDIKISFMDGFGAVIGFILVFIAIAVAVCQVYDILTCIHFPEKMIFNYVSNMLSTSR